MRQELRALGRCLRRARARFAPAVAHGEDIGLCAGYDMHDHGQFRPCICDSERVVWCNDLPRRRNLQFPVSGQGGEDGRREGAAGLWRERDDRRGVVERREPSEVQRQRWQSSSRRPGGRPDEISWSHDLTFEYITFDAAADIRPGVTGSAMLFDHDRFDGLAQGTWEGRLNIFAGNNTGDTTPVGVTVSNSHFGGGGCSDGVHVSAYGVTVGPGNEFTDLPQTGCSQHVDPVQCDGSPHMVLTGNYFHDNLDGSGGLMCGNGEQHITVTNNVFARDPGGGAYPYSIHAGGAQNWLVQHNTFASGGLLRFEVQSVTPAGNLVRNNVFTSRDGISLDSGSNGYGTNDHNLNAGVSGVGNRKGRPIFLGGKNPTSYAGYRLAPRSQGKGSASDGDDMGIRARGSRSNR